MFGKVIVGCAPIGNLFRSVSDEEAGALLDAAWDLGWRSLDTAPLYGHGLSEQRIGSYLGAQPERAFEISTKVGRRLDPGAAARPSGFVDTPDAHPVFDYGRDGILRSFESSLQRLGVERVETLLLHDIGALVHGDRHQPVLRQALDEALPAMRELQAQGLVGRVGLGVNEWEVCAQVLARTDLDVILLAGRFTLLDQAAAQFLDSAAERGVQILGAGVFNSGLLAGGSTFNYMPAPAEVIARRDAVEAVCARHAVALPAAAIHFVARNSAISQVVLGLRNPEQLRQASDWVAEAPPEALWEELRHEALIA